MALLANIAKWRAGESNRDRYGSICPEIIQTAVVLKIGRGKSMNVSLVAMWAQMGPLAKGVVVVLAIMSVWSIGVMVERFITFSQARKQSREFAPAVAEALKNGRIDEAISIADQHPKSHLAKVVSAGLQEFQAHISSKDIPGETIEASRRALQRNTAIGIEELKRG